MRTRMRIKRGKGGKKEEEKVRGIDDVSERETKTCENANGYEDCR